MNPHSIRSFAPGRVNLMGEHTDYNDGLCLPFAVELGVSVTAKLRSDTEVVSPDLPEDDPYLRGVVTELRRAGVDVPGCTLGVTSDLPQGAGLSSSAALCVALALALSAASGGEPPSSLELARLCSRVESEWTGAETGLLDQLASLLGTEGSAVRLDMRTLAAVPVPLELGDHMLAVVDSGASRRLARSGYNERRAQCGLAAAALGLSSLRDASDADCDVLPAPLDGRVRHVVSENARVDAAVAALADGDLTRLGELLDASHASLRDDYEVSVPEVERAVARCRVAGALGARIMGGGFGGSVLALFPPGTELPAGATHVSPGRGATVC